MKKLIILLVLLMSTACFAQVEIVPDSVVHIWWEEYPGSRPMLKEYFPDVFKLAKLDTTLWEGWKVYAVNNGEEYYAVMKVGGNWIAAVELGDKQGYGYAKGFIGSDSLLIFGPSVIGVVPKHIQDLLDKLN